MVVRLSVGGPPGLLCIPSGVPPLPALVGCEGAVPRSPRRCTGRVSSSPKVGTDLSHLSPPFSNFPILPPAPTPRVFIAAQTSSSNHLPRSFYTDQGFQSLNLFRADAPRFKAKVIGPTATSHRQPRPLHVLQHSWTQGKASRSSRCRLAPTRNVLGAPRYVWRMRERHLVCPVPPCPVCLSPDSNGMSSSKEGGACGRGPGWTWTEASVDGDGRWGF